MSSWPGRLRKSNSSVQISSTLLGATSDFVCSNNFAAGQDRIQSSGINTRVNFGLMPASAARPGVGTGGLYDIGGRIRWLRDASRITFSPAGYPAVMVTRFEFADGLVVVQDDAVIPLARSVAEFGAAVAEPWRGARPTLPDSLPIIGTAPRHPGLWLAFGHQHIGFTTGPATGAAIAAMISGAQPSFDITPFSPRRYL